MKKALLLLLALLLTCTGSPAGAAVFGEAIISQVVQDRDTLYVVFSKLDENGDVTSSIDPDDATLYVGDQAVDAGLSILSRSAYGMEYVFVLDNAAAWNKSMLTALKTNMKEWIAGMGDADRVALVSFSENAAVATGFASPQGLDPSVLDSLTSVNTQAGLYEGIREGLSLLAQPGSSRAVFKALVVVSCGIQGDQGVADLPSIIQTANEYGVPIYVLGMQTNGRALDRLAELTKGTGGRIFIQDRNLLPVGIKKLRSYIGNSYVAVSTLSGEALTGGTKDVTIALKEKGGTVVKDSRSYGFTPVAQTPPPAAAPPSRSPKPASVAAVPTSVPTSAPTEPEPLASDPGVVTPGISRRLVFIFAVSAIAVAATLFIMTKKQRKKMQKDSELEREHLKLRELDDAIVAPVDSMIAGVSGDHAIPLAVHEDKTVFLGRMEEPVAVLRLTDVDTGTVYSASLKDKASVGRRSGENDVVLPDKTVSGKHCVFVMEDNRTFIKDLGSANGTRLFEGGRYRPIDAHNGAEIKSGNKICLGETILEISIDKPQG